MKLAVSILVTTTTMANPANQAPTFVSPTPLADSTLTPLEDGTVKFIIQAIPAPGSAIMDFEYKKSNDMHCERFSGTEVACKQTLSTDDMANANFSQKVCYKAVAMTNKPIESEWRCNTIKSPGTTSQPDTPVFIRDTPADGSTLPFNSSGVYAFNIYLDSR